jgi:hypothetical protein
VPCGLETSLLFTAFLPALAIMIVLNNVAEEIGCTGFVFARLQKTGTGRCAPPWSRLILLWPYHLPGCLLGNRQPSQPENC